MLIFWTLRMVSKHQWWFGFMCGSSCKCTRSQTNTVERTKIVPLRILGMSWGIKSTCFEAPGVSIGGPGVSIRGVRIRALGIVVCKPCVRWLFFRRGHFNDNQLALQKGCALRWNKHRLEVMYLTRGIIILHPLGESWNRLGISGLDGKCTSM